MSELPPDPSDGSDPVTPPQPVTQINSKRHPEFYFDNTLVVIQVEDTLFNVHKYQLLKSEAFTDMFKAQEESPKDLSSREGLTPDNPIVLGVKVSEFGALLTLLYATHFASNRPSPETPLIVPAFRLANIWRFSDLRTYLIPLAEKILEDADKIAFAREFNLPEWLSPAHVRLCQRPEPLTREEATRIGIDSVLMISRVREEFPPKQGSNQVQSCSGFHYTSGRYNSSYTGHCPTCVLKSNSNRLTPAGITQAIEERVNKWVGTEYTQHSPASRDSEALAGQTSQDGWDLLGLFGS